MTVDGLDPRFGLVPDPVATDPMLGRIIQDKYEIKRAIGAGGMGTVYEAVHRIIGKRVAVKVLHRELSSNAELVQRFVREARAATAIGHPHIVEVFDMGSIEGGGFFQVLELLEGKSLAQDLDDHGPLSYARAVKILSQVADALSATHAKGIVHRDLKPDNIFLVPRPGDPDFVKLLDFGIAKMADAAGSKTRTGLTLGTAAYMSPEQARGAGDIDARTDIFSLGVMTYQVLACARPFESDSYAGLIFEICTAEAPPLSKHRRDVPTGLDDVMAKLLAKRREDRYASCVEVKAALAPFAAYDAPPVLRDRGSRDDAMARLSTMPSGEALGILDPRNGRPVNEAPPASAEPGTGPLRASVDVSVPVAAAAPRPYAAATRSEIVETDAIPGVRPPHRLLAVVGVAGLLALLAIGGWVVSGGAMVGGAGVDARSEGAAQEVVSVVATSTTTSPPPPTVPAVEAAVNGTVHISLRAEPREATLYLDDVAVPNPYIADLPASAEPHIVEARLEGHLSSHRPVSFARSIDVTIALSRDGSPVAAPEPHGTHGSSAHGSRPQASERPSSTSATQALPPAVAEPPPPVAEPSAPAVRATAAPPTAPAAEPETEAPPQALKRVRL